MVRRWVLGVTFAVAVVSAAGCGGNADIVMLTNSAVLRPGQAEPFARHDAGLVSAATAITIDGMSSSSGSQTGTVSDISGRAGSAIASVRILLDDGREITASTSNGWFYAWWQGESPAVSLLGDDPTGRTVASATP